VPAYQPCTTPNTGHGAPLSYGSCAPPAQTSSFLTVGTPNANGAAANSIGSVLYRAQINSPPTQNDLLINVLTTDVRCKLPVNTTCGAANAAAGPDYAGQLQVIVPIRITDHFNGGNGSDQPTAPATMMDVRFPMTLPCGSADPSIGSVCGINTSFNALYPGSQQFNNGNRVIWELGQVQVFDGGASGSAGASDATLFMDEGVFVP
jgi:hypothetical protein